MWCVWLYSWYSIFDFTYFHCITIKLWYPRFGVIKIYLFYRSSKLVVIWEIVPDTWVIRFKATKSIDDKLRPYNCGNPITIRRQKWRYIRHLNKWKCSLAENKDIKLLNNNISDIKKYIYQRCYQVTKNNYGNPKSLNLSLIK